MQSANALLLAASAYSPAVLNQQYNYTETASDADQNWFRGNHSTTYESFGFQSGAYQRADWNPSGTTVTFRYQGGIYSSASGAQNAYNDGISYVQQQFSGAKVSNCSNNTAVVLCTSIVFPYQDNSGNQFGEEYDLVQIVGTPCMAETTADFPASAPQSLATQIGQTQTNIDVAAANAMQSACGGGSTGGGTTSFNVISVRFEKNGAKPDYDLSNPPLVQAKTKQKVQLAVYFQVQSLPQDSPDSIEFVIKQGGQTVFDKTYQHTIQLSDLPDTYVDTISGLKFTKAGGYSAQATVTINGQQDGSSASLSVKKKVVTKKVSFKFSSLQSRNAGGSPTSTFKVGQQVVLGVTYTVKHLKGHTTGIITRSILANFGGTWKAVNTNVVSETVLNGKNSNVVSAQFSGPGTFQIAIGLTIGSSHQTKVVTVTVTR